ncbi:DMT family transporter [Salinibacillus xinjiangensis]|uniref:EamA family transporter n=1 Tax=Salinibacillus xinjiangensis TaxID=1229268 RepID=A0A6G1X208_9BACI|nr:DMT family transporter [Salinibacillus xinjiangensis]MRG84926.1 EamA family transporter [Salinibacillus xinjiangensis]
MKKTYALLVFVMMMWGFNVSAIKVLVDNVEPILLTSFRIFTAGVVVLILTYFLGIFRLPNKKELGILLYIAIFNVIVHHSAIAVGLGATSGVNGGLILGMGPLTTMMLSIIFLGQRMTKFRIIGFILGFIGVVTTTLSGSGGVTSMSFGDVIVFVGMLVQAYSFILISKLNPSFDPRLLTGYMLFIGSFHIYIISLFEDSSLSQLSLLIDWQLGSVFLFSAVICTAVGHMVYNSAIKQVGPAESAIFINFNTMFAIFGSALFLGETIRVSHLIGLVLIVCGVLIGSGTVEYWKRSLAANREVTNKVN